MYWDWKLARNGVLKFGFMLFLFYFIFKNLDWLNGKFLSKLPVGFFLLLILTLLILQHIYRVFNWYKTWFKYGRKPLWNIIIHLCLYLIIVSVVLSLPLTLDRISVSSGKTTDNYPDITKEVVTSEEKNEVSPAATPIPSDVENKVPQQSNIDTTTPYSMYKTDSKIVNYEYVLRGNRGYISYTVYGGLNTYLKSLPRAISYYYNEPSEFDFINRDLNDETQKLFLDPLIIEIQNLTSNKDDQARIAVSLVQNLDYDWDAFEAGNVQGKYPYEVLYTGSGVCSEKTKLLVYLLRGLGYGVSIFRFDETENFTGHDALGLACPQQYSYENTGYCFVETTTPSIITDISGYYYSTGNNSSIAKLPKTPRILKICDGSSFGSVDIEYSDAIEYNRLMDKGKVLSSGDYYRWKSLVTKYGIKFSN